jgi:endonuclease YncB( thermonuclease family)
MRRGLLNSMFGWRKKNDGFDWHQYVRTTIKVRREARRERIDAARQAALDQAHAAGHAVAQGGKAAGKAAVQGAQVGAEHGVKSVAWFWENLARAFRVAFGPFGEWLMAKTARLGGTLKLWDFAGPIALVGVMAAASGAYRWKISGLTAETAVPLGLGLVLLALAAPALLSRSTWSWPKNLSIPKNKMALAASAGVVAISAGAYAISQQTGGASLPSLGSLTKISLIPGGGPPVEGRAAVLSGDTLRLNSTSFRLSGIEAPEKNQSCMKPGNRRWRCGESAVSAFEKLAKGKSVKCNPSGGADATGRIAATCTVEGRDIAADLVRGGHVFSASSVFGGYSSQENEAKAAKNGIWNGEAERPAAYRSKLWEEAKKASPDGCPIKAVSNSGTKVYVLPWAEGYRKTSVKTSKGERWFCSESDATAAGYKIADRG